MSEIEEVKEIKEIKEIKIKKTRKDYNKKYYEKNKEQIIKYICEKKECSLCGKNIARKTMKNHQKTNLCKKICLKNKYEKWLKDENETIKKNTVELSEFE